MRVCSLVDGHCSGTHVLSRELQLVAKGPSVWAMLMGASGAWQAQTALLFKTHERLPDLSVWT